MLLQAKKGLVYSEYCLQPTKSRQKKKKEKKKERKRKKERKKKKRKERIKIGVKNLKEEKKGSSSAIIDFLTYSSFVTLPCTFAQEKKFAH